jgi:phytoene synthase
VNGALRASYSFCSRLARREARNFYYAFLLLPPELRRSMCALYAFMRHSDDLADTPRPLPERHALMTAWRAEVREVLEGRSFGSWLGAAALAHTVEQHQIPHQHLEELLDGVAMDLEPRSFVTFADLRDYCYHVASTVGLCCLKIWGYESCGGRAEELAEECGIALQLTNIVRDVREDGLAGRVYLPQEDLERFGIDAAAILAAGPPSDNCRALLAFECQRARDHYNRAEPLIKMVAPVGRPVFATIFGIYRALLEEIVARDYDVFTERVALSGWRKSMIALKSLATRFGRWRLQGAAAEPLSSLSPRGAVGSASQEP